MSGSASTILPGTWRGSTARTSCRSAERPTRVPPAGPLSGRRGLRYVGRRVSDLDGRGRGRPALRWRIETAPGQPLEVFHVVRTEEAEVAPVLSHEVAQPALVPEPRAPILLHHPLIQAQ